jgi:hypothetical protein
MRPLLLALLLAGCGSTSWTVSGGTPAEQAQVHELVAAAEVALPDVADVLAEGGRVFIVAEPDTVAVVCGVGKSGCIGGGVWVLWPHPACTEGATFWECSAMAHELGHIAPGDVRNCDQERAEQRGRLIKLQYAKDHP